MRAALVLLAGVTVACGAGSTGKRVVADSTHVPSHSQDTTQARRERERAEVLSRLSRPLDLSGPTVIVYGQYGRLPSASAESTAVVFFRGFRDSIAHLEPLFNEHGFVVQEVAGVGSFQDELRQQIYSTPSNGVAIGVILYVPGYRPEIVPGIQPVAGIRERFLHYARAACVGPDEPCRKPSAS